MSDRLISVIVPFYNLEKYVKTCLESILGQSYDNLEIIAIDDGSSDKTAELLAEYEKNDKRLVLVRQANAGAGAASNRGIDLARGEYLTFADNDDWIEPTMYERLLAALEGNKADMAVCNFNLVYPDRRDTCYSNMRTEADDVYDDVYGYFCRHCACAKPNNYTWTRLYKSKIVKDSGVRFENFRLGADTLFNFKLLPYMKRAAFINEGLYNYVQRRDSSVFTAARAESLASVYADGFEALANYYSAGGFNEFLSVLPIHAFTRLRSVFFYSRLAGMGDDEIEADIKEGFAGRMIGGYLTGAVG
ncbi:MAG: glycosyltransferase [Clostridiales Family XIII bacterium]|jgi:glycosyltransferase involved in cell wall biosynthesis|nr:glycosyltransferase [Clostridiales Family XIII bacterium]